MREIDQTEHYMMTPEIGKHYMIKHSTGITPARCVSITTHPGYTSLSYSTRTTTRYHFYVPATKRNVVLKSRVKILTEVL
jgi:hypothetical protein